MPQNWPLFVALAGIAALVAQFLWSNFFDVRATLTADFGDRVRLAGTKIIADKYMPRLAELIQGIQESGIEPGDPSTVAELTSTEFFDTIIALYEPLRERSDLDEGLTALKRRGERVAKLGGVVVFTLPLSYFVMLWPVPLPSDPYRTIFLTLWAAMFVLVPFCAATWNLCLFWRDRAQLDEALDSLTAE